MREFTDEYLSPQQMKNHHKKRRSANNLPSLAVEERSFAVSARVVTLPQNVHTRTVFPSSTRVAPVCQYYRPETVLPLMHPQKLLHSKTRHPRMRVHQPRTPVASTSHQACVADQVPVGDQGRACAVPGMTSRRSV